MALTPTSPAFADGGALRGRHAGDGLHGRVRHRARSDLSPARGALPESVETGLGRHNIRAAVNDSGTARHRGPEPPAGGPAHRCAFRLAALDLPAIALPAETAAAAIRREARTHRLAEAALAGICGRWTRRGTRRDPTQRKEDAMQVHDAMTPDPRLLDPNATIRDAAAAMRDADVGAMPVGENDRLIGMVTDRDIALRAVAEGQAPGDTTVRSVMSDRVYYCYEDAELGEAAQLMAEHQVQRLPVLNRDKRLVGILAIADIARTDADALATACRGICQPSAAARA